MIIQQQMNEEIENFMNSNMQSMLKAIEDSKLNCAYEIKYMEGKFQNQ